MLLEPNILINALEQRFSEAGNTTLLEQIEYLQQEIEAKQREDERLYRAYVAGAFDEHEFSAQRRALKEQSQKLAEEVARLKGMVLTYEEVELEKQFVLNTVEHLEEIYDLAQVPFDVKQRILKMVVDRIVLNTNEGWFKLSGAVSGIYSLVNDEPSPPSDKGNDAGESSTRGDSPKKSKRAAIVNRNALTPAPHRGSAAAYSCESLV